MIEQPYSDQEWQALHEEIQKRFRALAGEVRLAAQSVQPQYGKTITKRFPLFSHVSFPLQNAGASNDIIVGVDIGSENGQWQIDADVCEEESGTIFFELPNAPFSASSFQELTDQVLRTVDRLTAGARPVLSRLLGASTSVLPSQPATVTNLANKT